MEELQEMTQNPEFTVEDIVTEVVKKISANKRADETRVFRILNVLYNFSRSTCASLLDAVMKKKRILKVHGLARFYYVIRDCEDFHVKRLLGGGLVSEHIADGNQVEFAEFKKSLVESGHFKSEKEFTDAVIDDIVAEKIRLFNDEVVVYSEDEDPSSGSESENESVGAKKIKTEQISTVKVNTVDLNSDDDVVDTKKPNPKNSENSVLRKPEGTSRPIKRPQKDIVPSDPPKRRKTAKKPIEVISPVTKSGRVSSKKWDEDYYFPNLHKRNRARRMLPPEKLQLKTEKEPSCEKTVNTSVVKIEKEENAVSKNEESVSKNDTKCEKMSEQLAKAIAGPCKVCDSNCRFRDLPFKCKKCRLYAHPACVKIEQGALGQEFSAENWTCINCRQFKKRLSCANCVDPSSRWLGPLIKCANCLLYFHEKCLGQKQRTGQGLAYCIKCFFEERNRVAMNKGNPVSNMLVIEGINCHEPAGKIRNELRKMGYNVLKVTNMISNKNKMPLNMFSINMKSVASHSRLFKLKHFLGYEVKVKTPFSLKTDETKQIKKVKQEVIEIPDSEESSAEKTSEDEKSESDVTSQISPEISDSEDEIPNWHVLVDPQHPTLAPSRPQNGDREWSPCQGSLAPQIPELTVSRIPSRQDIPSQLLRPNRLHPPLDRPFPDPEVPDCENWTIAQVARYFERYVSQEVAEILTEKNVDGHALKSLNRSQVLTGLNIKIDVALKILFHVKRLQLRTNDRTLIYADET